MCFNWNNNLNGLMYIWIYICCNMFICFFFLVMEFENRCIFKVIFVFFLLFWYILKNNFFMIYINIKLIGEIRFFNKIFVKMIMWMFLLRLFRGVLEVEYCREFCSCFLMLYLFFLFILYDKFFKKR